MLVLARKVGEKIIIGDDIHVCVVAVQGGNVRLGISAPRNVLVDREEVHAMRVSQGLAPKPPPVPTPVTSAG